MTQGGTVREVAFTQTNLFGTPAAIATAAAGRPAPAEPPAIAVLDPDTAVTLTASAPATASLTGAACRDSRSLARPFGTLDGTTLTVPAQHLAAGSDLRCVFVYAVLPGLHGRLFNDDGAGGGTANDGLPNGAEAGLPGLPVHLTDCGVQRLQTSVSATDGGFVLQPPARRARGAPLCIEAPGSASRQPTGASIGALALPAGTPTGAGLDRLTYRRTAVGGLVRLARLPTGDRLNFGSVPVATWGPAGAREGEAGSTVLHAHRFTAGTAGTVSFTLPATAATPPTEGWAERIFADPGCTGSLQAEALRLYPPVLPRSLAAGESLCVVLQESIPPLAPPGSRNRTRLQARFDFSHATPALESRHALDDITTVGAGTPPAVLSPFSSRTESP